MVLQKVLILNNRCHKPHIIGALEHSLKGTCRDPSRVTNTFQNPGSRSQHHKCPYVGKCSYRRVRRKQKKKIVGFKGLQMPQLDLKGHWLAEKTPKNDCCSEPLTWPKGFSFWAKHSEDFQIKSCFFGTSARDNMHKTRISQAWETFKNLVQTWGLWVRADCRGHVEKLQYFL